MKKEKTARDILLKHFLGDYNKALFELRTLIIDGLPKKENCSNPVGHSAQRVTRDIAIDACDTSLEGKVFRDEEWEQCGSCYECIKQQVIDDVKSAIDKLLK